MSRTKETNFFINNKKFSKGLDFYQTYFKCSKNVKAIGESSPGYLCYPEVYKRIKQYLGDVKIVIILRDPVKRAYSQYWDNRRQLNEYLTDIEIIEQHLDDQYQPGKKGYFSRGIYFRDVSNFIKTFKNENVKVIILEELIRHQQRELEALYQFLGISTHLGLQVLPKPSNASVVWNNLLYKSILKHPKFIPYIPKSLRRLLFFGRKENFKYTLPEKAVVDKVVEFYRPWNRKLENLLGIELKYWLK
jgi:hypothetical protein